MQGALVGWIDWLGAGLALWLGAGDGGDVGTGDGDDVGDDVGLGVGDDVGDDVGDADGTDVGADVGIAILDSIDVPNNGEDIHEPLEIELLRTWEETLVIISDITKQRSK